MPYIDSYFGPSDYGIPKNELLPNVYLTLILLNTLAVTLISAAKFAELNNRLNYENRVARILCGFIMLMMNLFHTKKGDLELDGAGKLIAIGPHRTSVEAFVVASKIRGAPPQFFATDVFDTIPGVAAFMRMFKTIPVKANGPKDKGQSSNSKALELAQTALDKGGCVALFPQGGFSRLGQEPLKIYTGAAKLALMQNVPIHVIRLDGFWCLKNPLIPLFIRNHTFYRAFFSLFHMNNIRTNLCCVIDFHLKKENHTLSDEEKIKEICAQLYAYYRDTKELSDTEISGIKTQISDKTHLLLWEKRLQKDALLKQHATLEKEPINSIKA